MPRVCSRSKASFEILLFLLLLLQAPSLSLTKRTCRGPNNEPVQDPECRDAKCQAEGLAFAVCTDDPTESGSVNTSLHILIKTEDENDTVTAVEGDYEGYIRMVEFHQWIHRLEDCSGCDLLILSTKADIPKYSSLVVRVETVAKVKLYGLYFIESPERSLASASQPSEWVIILGYILQAAKTADGKILPDNVDQFSAIFSSPKTDSLKFRSEKVAVALMEKYPNNAGPRQVQQFQWNMSSCPGVWCEIDIKQSINSSNLSSALRSEKLILTYHLPERSGAKNVYIRLQMALWQLWKYTEPPASTMPERRLAYRDSCPPVLRAGSAGLSATLVAIAVCVCVAAVVVVCTPLLFIACRNRKRENRRILLIASASPHCLRQLQRQRRRPLSHEHRWHQLCKRAAALGYHLMVIDCRQPINASQLQSMIVGCSRVLILDDENDTGENVKNRQLPQALQRLALMEKHRCTLLQWQQQQLTQQLLYASIKNFLDEVIGNDKQSTDRHGLLAAKSGTPSSNCSSGLHV